MEDRFPSFTTTITLWWRWGGDYRLRHWSLVAEEKGVGGTPSFRNELSFDFGQSCIAFFLTWFWDLVERAREQETPVFYFLVVEDGEQTSGMISY
jgi:hypothetical protein